MRIVFVTIIVLAVFAGSAAFGEEPTLPIGLSDEPQLPFGIDQPDSATLQQEQVAELPFTYSGFLESRAGVRTSEDNMQKDATIGEMRTHLEVERSASGYALRLATDLVVDTVANRYPLDLENGQGFLDLREASALVRLGEQSDLRFGRQILTWGVGDYIFINDLFPKDWKSFFVGRDDEYLKAPSDAVRFSNFNEYINLDFVYTPRFDPDRFIDGERVSFFNPALGGHAGRDDRVMVDQRAEWFSEDEMALRFFRNISGIEVALYGYLGYWKSPAGSDFVSGRVIHPRLNVYGASARGVLLSGVASTELGYYDSRSDSDGDDPSISNSEWRALFGYDRELFSNFSMGAQYYLELIEDYAAYSSTLPPAVPKRDKERHLLTLRLTRMLLDQNLKLSLFQFFSPSDQDAYSRVSGNYKFSDNWSAEAGLNAFYGRRNYSFFGQFEDASNVFLALRYGFVG